jgi:hypothetical protein
LVDARQLPCLDVMRRFGIDAMRRSHRRGTRRSKRRDAPRRHDIMCPRRRVQLQRNKGTDFAGGN